MQAKTKLQVIKDSPQMVERAFLVGLQRQGENDADIQELLDELGELVTTMGVAVAGRLVARISAPSPRFLVGSGKAAEIVQQATDLGADVIVFDEALSPAQQRNWEKLSPKIAVIDRQEVILDIFGQRAKTREAELQIGLARAKYDLPRLKRRWTHLHRQRGAAGGHGMRGEGEQQIEVDSRMVKRRIGRLQQLLDEVRQKRHVQRRKRMRKPVPNCAIVGYTNAGKSSLLNRLTGAHAFVENKLFATLDPTIRRLVLPNQQELLLSDTVGFIRKLPHALIEAFKATLEEAALADFLIEVIDINSPRIDEHHQTTIEVLRELGAENKPRLVVFNKLDLNDDPFKPGRLALRFPDAAFISIRSGAGLDELANRLADEIGKHLELANLAIPVGRYDLVALLHRTSHIHSETVEDERILVQAAIPPALRTAFAPFLVPPQRH